MYCAKKKTPDYFPVYSIPNFKFPPTPKLRELSIMTCTKSLMEEAGVLLIAGVSIC